MKPGYNEPKFMRDFSATNGTLWDAIEALKKSLFVLQQNHEKLERRINDHEKRLDIAEKAFEYLMIDNAKKDGEIAALQEQLAARGE
jgi:predicted  nucleic acid-binding Zn-ribbon protein